MSGKPVILKPPSNDPELRRVRWTDELGNRRQQSYRTLKAAKAAQQAIASKLERGTRTSRDKLTLGELCREWWDEYALAHTAVSTRQRMYLPALRNWIYPEMGKVIVARIDRKAVDSFVSRMVRAGAAPPTIRVTMTTLSSILQRGVEWGYIDTNPARGVRRPAEIVEERAAYEPAEVYKIASRMRLDRDKALVVFTAFTGLRQSEVFGLDWKHIGSDEFKVWRPKTKKWSTIPLFEPAKDAIMQWRVLAPRSTGLVFPSASQTRLQGSTWGRRHWRPATALAGMAKCGACGEPTPDTMEVAKRIAVSTHRAAERVAAYDKRKSEGRTVTGPRPLEPWECESCGSSSLTGPEFHELRHTFGTLAAYATGDLLQVAEWMGHSDTKMLAKRYKHQLERGRSRAVEQMNALVKDWA